MNKRNVTLGILLLAGVMANSSTVYGMNKQEYGLNSFDTDNLCAFNAKLVLIKKMDDYLNIVKQLKKQISKENDTLPSFNIKLYDDKCVTCKKEFTKKIKDCTNNGLSENLVALYECGHTCCYPHYNEHKSKWEKDETRGNRQLPLNTQELIEFAAEYFKKNPQLLQKSKLEKNPFVIKYNNRYETSCPECKILSQWVIKDLYKNLQKTKPDKSLTLQAAFGLYSSVGQTPISSLCSEFYIRMQQLAQISNHENLILKNIKELKYHLSTENLVFVTEIRNQVYDYLENKKEPSNSIVKAVLAKIMKDANYTSKTFGRWEGSHRKLFGTNELIMCSYISFMLSIEEKNVQKIFAKIKQFAKSR